MNDVTKKIRNSNYELMRIVSMFLIVLCHVVNLGHLVQNSTIPFLTLLFRFIIFFTLVHVNSFVLLCGYFQSETSFKQSSVWKIVNASWFYRIIIMIILLCLGLVSVDKVTFIKEAFPLNVNEYWFIKVYLLLYCLSPFINKAISNFNKSDYHRLILVLFIILCLVPFLMPDFFSNSGYTLYSFVFLYIIGAYLRRYPLNKSYIFKKMSNNMFQIVLILIFLFSLFANFINSSFFASIVNYNPITKEFANFFVRTSMNYSNPFVVIQSITYFVFFGTLAIKNNSKINKLASLTFGVYLIHDNNFIRDLLYKRLLIDNGPVHSYKMIIYAFACAIIIYIVCSIIEYLRQVLFKFIYNRKFATKIRERYYTYIRGVHFLSK